jgi:Na+/melibiose symporter-like transporter
MSEILIIIFLILFFVFLKMAIASYLKKTNKKLLYSTLCFLCMVSVVLMLLLFPTSFKEVRSDKQTSPATEFEKNHTKE